VIPVQATTDHAVISLLAVNWSSVEMIILYIFSFRFRV